MFDARDMPHSSRIHTLDKEVPGNKEMVVCPLACAPPAILAYLATSSGWE